jgi:outer membrane protein
MKCIDRLFKAAHFPRHRIIVGFQLGDLMHKPLLKRVPILAVAALGLFSAALPGQQATVTIDIRTALERARTYSPRFLSASIDVDLARIDRYLAKRAFYPSAEYHNQMIYTQGNGTTEGIFVGNNGVHEYISQGTVRQDVFVPGRLAEYRRSLAAEAVAAARRDVVMRGIVTTVFQDYYGIVVAQRHLANARQSRDEAQHFVTLTEKLESGGEAAHADVVKARLTLQQRERDVQDSQFSVEKNRIALAVLIFPDVITDYAVVDDLSSVPTLEEFNQVQAQANETSPDLRAARATLNQEQYGIAIARSAYLPSLTFEYFYGIDSPRFAARDLDGFRRLGSGAQATLNIPIFDWWTTKRKVKQAELKREQAQLDLTLTQRELSSNLQSAYLEAKTSLAQIDSLKRSLDLAAESLRLTSLRYEAGESSVLEVVDAQATLTQARNAYDDGLSRYRLAIATIQTLTGNY